jgi:hypothetical protein
MRRRSRVGLAPEGENHSLTATEPENPHRPGYCHTVDRYPFLSHEWFTQVRRLHEAYDQVVPLAVAVRMNLMIRETPFGADLPIHMTAEGGQADWGEGHLDEPDVTLIMGYETAREIFVGGNPQAAMEAFMAGKIIMQGDISKLMEMQLAQPGPRAPELTRAMQEITE